MNQSPSRWTPEEELDHLIELAQGIADDANRGYEGTRKVALGAAAEIAQRVYHENLSKAFSIKKHAVATAVSHFIVLSQRNKVITASAAYTDLLPIAHPNSTRDHSLHPNEVMKARARWYADDPKITDPTVKALISSALSAPLGSAEQVYAATRLAALNATPLMALTAAYKPGANNFFWMVQLRDSEGRWAEMGGGVSVIVRMPDGTLRRLSGTVVGARFSERNKSDRFNYFVLETGDGSLVKVPASKAKTIKALIPSQRTANGFSKTTTRAATGDPILDFSELKKVSAPPGYKKDRNWAPDENDVEYYGTRADMGEMYTDGNYRIRKFKRARDSWLARDDFSVARQREAEGQDIVAIGAGPNGELDLNKPVYFVSRDDERGNRVFAAVQSWEDAMAFARQDEPRYQKDELPSPERNPRFKNPNEEAAAGRAPSNEPIPRGRAPRRAETRRPVRFEDAPTPEAAPTPTPAAREEIDPANLTPDELAAGYGFTKNENGSYTADGQDGAVDIEQLPNGQWNVTQRTDDEGGTADLGSFESPAEAFDNAQAAARTPEFDEGQVADFREDQASGSGQQPREMPDRGTEAPITDIEDPSAPEAIDELPEGGDIVTPGRRVPTEAPRYVPVGPTEGQSSSDFTDDPVELAQKFTRDQLVSGLKEALDSDGDFVSLPFSDGDEPVPVEAIFEAVRMSRRPTATQPATLPDGVSEQREALNARINELTESGDIIRDDNGRLTAVTPEAQEVLDQSTELDAFEDQGRGLSLSRADAPPLLQGLSDEELQDYFETGDYRQYLPGNDNFTDVPEGFYPIDSLPSDASDLIPNSYPDRLANNFTPEELKAQLSDAIRGGSGYGLLGIENEAGEIVEMRVPAEALRDALQLQGEDTNEFIRSVLTAPVRTVPARTPKPRAERKKSTAESANPTAAYMFKNGRAFISQRAGKIFSNNPDVRKYLDDNGFTYDRAKNIAFETAEMDETSFYNFMRGLRDDFGVDLLPGKGQDSVDFDKDPAPRVTPNAESKKIVAPSESVDALQGLVNRKNELDAEIADLEADSNADPAAIEARKRTRDTVQRNIDKIRGVDDGEGPRRVNIPTSGLQEGDVVQSDFFTIESIAEEPGVVWGGQQVYRITGYYPGSQTQSSKLWKADREIPVFRGVTPPEKGDLPEINQPNAEEDFVKLPVKQNMDKYEKIEDYEGRGKGVYVPADPGMRADFDRAYRSYLEELDRRMATWQPNLEEANTEAVSAGNPPITSGARSAINISPADLQPGDIFYKQNADGSYEAFVVEDIKVKKAATLTRVLRRKIDTPAGEGQTDVNPQAQGWLDEVRAAHSDIDNEDSDMRISALSAALNDELLAGNAKIDRNTGQLKSGDKAQWLIDQIENLSNGRDISVGGETPVDEAFEEITEEVTIGVDKVEITGYYPGYASQKLTRQANTTLSAIRGEPTLPAKGEDRLPQSPDPRDPDFMDKYDARKAAIAEASRAYPVTPTDVSDLKAASLRKPYPEAVRPAFEGKIAELIEENEVNTGEGVKELLKNNRVVYFDFETVGKGFDEENPDSPIQVAAIVYEDGVEVDRINLFINPEESLGEYYYDNWSRPKSTKIGTKAKQMLADRFVEIEKTDEDEWTDLETGQKFDTDGALSRGKILRVNKEGNTFLRADRMRDADGNPVTEEWLATQPGKKEQLQKLVDFIGQDAILVGYNGQFDANILEKWAEKLGVDYTPNGYFDPMAIRKSLTEGQYNVKNSLKDTAKTYGMGRPDEDWHNADVDVDVLPGIVDALLSEMPELSNEFDLAARREKFERDRAYDERKMEIYQRELARQKGASVDDVQENEIPVTETKKPTTTGSSVDEEVLVETTDRTAESVFGDDINTEWFKDDENAYNVAPAGEATFNDVVVGDGIATEGGAYNEVVDVLPNPDSPNGAVILHRDLETNRVYETKVADKNTKLTGAPLRRRVELEGLTSSEIKQLANAAQKRKTAAAQRGKNPGKPKVKAVTEPARQKSKEIDNAVESGAPTEDLEKPALPGSFQHLDANNLPLDEKDKVRNIKDPESGVGEVLYNKDKGYVRVKFPNAAKAYKRKPHDVAADSLEMVDMPEGQRRVAEASRQKEKAANKTTKDRAVEAITPDSPEGMSRRIKALGSYLVNGPGYSREIGDALKRATRAISQGNLKEAQYWINEAEGADKRLKQRNRNTESLRAEFQARRASLTKNPEDPAFTPPVQNALNRADEFFRGGDARKALAELTKAEDTFFAYGDVDVDVLETGDDQAPEGSRAETQRAYRLFERESILESARLEKEGVEGKTPLRELTRAQARDLLIRLQTTNYEVPNKEARLAALLDAAESGDYEQFEEIGFSIDFDRQKFLDSQGRSPEGVRSRDDSDEEVINDALAEFRKLRQSQQDEFASSEEESLSEEEAAAKATTVPGDEPPSVTHVVDAEALLPGDVILYNTPEGEKSGVVSSIEEMDDLRFKVTVVDDTGRTETKFFSGTDLIEILPNIPASDPVDNMNYGLPGGGEGGDGSMNRFNMALPSESDDPGEDTAADADRPTSQASEDDFADLEVPATKEQRDILAAALDGKSIAVTAVAGSGKSTTLRLLANVLKDRQPGKKLLYLAFGRDIRAEAEEKMPDNTEVRTTGSIAYAGVDRFIKEKLDKQSAREVPYTSTFRGIAKELGIEQTTLSMNGQEDEYAPDRIAKVVQDAVRNYSISADDELGVEHFDSRFDSIPDQLVDYARSYWADISSPIQQERVDKGDGKFENVVSQGKFKIDNDHIIKIWALSKPNIFSGESSSGLKKGAVDIVMIDEAQDINPVVGKVLADQLGQKIYVGDSAQAIYGFRGANDELDKAPVDTKLTLTQSFRFGEGVAGVANRLLSLLGAKYRVRGSDRPSKINEGIEDPDAILVRENQEGLALSEELLAAGKRVEITEDTFNNYMSLLSSARWLLRGNFERPKPFNMHDDLDLFEDWNDFGAAIGRREARSGAQFYRLVNNYVKTYGTGRGLDKLEEFLGGLTINSKGLKPASEYKGVNLKDVRPASFGSLISNKKSNGQLDYFITPDGQILLRQSPPFIQNKKVAESINTRRKTRLRRMGFTWDKTASFPGAPVRDGEEASGAWVRKLSQDEIDAGRTAPEVLPTNERKELLDRLGRAFNGFRETDEPTILITTAHKAKGLEWSKVRLSPGFREYGAEFDPATRTFKMPPTEEMNLLYVAVTRAMDELDVGGGGWLYSVTDDDEEDFSFPDPDENVMAMALPVESTDEETFVSDVKEARTRSEEIADRVSALVIQAIEAGGLPPWQKPWSEAGNDGILPFSVTSNKAYKGMNIMILWSAQQINGWTDNRWVTFAEAKKRGGSVKKGEKGTQIYNWSPVIKEVEKEDGTKERVVAFMKETAYTVFNIEQTSGVELPEREKIEPLPVSEAEALVLERYKGAPDIRNSPQDQAFWQPSEDYISIPLREQFSTQEAYLETLFHELVHSTGHRSRLDRSELMDKYGTHRASRGEEELVAEIGAALLAARVGVDLDFQQVAAYAKGWLAPLGNDTSMIVKATRQAQAAVDYILGDAEPNLGTSGVSGEDVPAVIAQRLGLELPQSYIGEYGRTGEEISAEASPAGGVAALQGEFQPGTPNTGELGNGMNYSIDMYENRLTSGRTAGETYGIRRMTVSGNTFPNREALKAANFRYNSDTKTWSKSYLGQVFEVSRLTQDVVNNNPNPEITSDIARLS
jgi:antirestriction protein ArdC/DNA polymerase III epsilon subunit-like protein/energy-coupling factor transporter ATP-binding protein EcfA2